MKLLRTLLLLFAFAFANSSIYAQGWEHTINLGQSQSATNVVPTTGGFIVYGFFGPATNAGENNIFVLKIDPLGNVIWSHVVNSPRLLYPTDMVATASGDVIMCGYTFDATDNEVFLARYTAAGDSLWLKTYGADTASYKSTSLVETSTHNIMVSATYTTLGASADTTYAPVIMLFDSSGDSLNTNFVFGHLQTNYRLSCLVNTKDHNVMAGGSYSNMSKPYFLKLNELGDTLWSSSIPYTQSVPDYLPFDMIQTRDSGYVMTGINLGGSSHPHTFLLKADKNGTLLWDKTIYDSAYYTYSFGLLENASGQLVLAENKESPNGTQPYFYFSEISITDTAGNIIKDKTFPGSLPNFPRYVSSVAQAQNGGYIFAGASGDDIYIVSTDSIGNVYPAHISGNIFADGNANCTLDTGETRLASWIITATGTNDTSYTVSDSIGNYTIDCDAGAFILSVQYASNYWSDTACAANLAVTVPQNVDTVFRDIAVAALVSCPQMQVQVSSAFLRRCSTHTIPYTIRYSNAGTQAATNVYAW